MKIAVVVISALIIVCGCIYVWYNFGDFPSNGRCLEHAAQFGDQFGAINSLFSSVAMGLALLAIILQAFELGMQRTELKRHATFAGHSTRTNAMTALLNHNEDLSEKMGSRENRFGQHFHRGRATGYADQVDDLLRHTMSSVNDEWKPNHQWALEQLNEMMQSCSQSWQAQKDLFHGVPTGRPNVEAVLLTLLESVAATQTYSHAGNDLYQRCETLKLRISTALDATSLNAFSDDVNTVFED